MVLSKPEVKKKVKQFKKYLWPIIGIAAMFLSIRVLYNEFTNPNSELSKLSWHELFERLGALSLHHWLFAAMFTCIAYAALAGYDRIALQFLGRKVSWIFVTLCSFTTYALSHNIGASVFSGAAVRYRAYSMKGLTGTEVALLVGFCSFTFVLGTILLSALVLIFRSDLVLVLRSELNSFFGTDFSPSTLSNISIVIGCILLAFVALYVIGSWVQMRPLKIGKKFQISYPKLSIVLQQLIIGPLELIGAAGIIYAILPDVSNPGFIAVLGAFLASFTVGLLSNAPGGGLGVFELIFMSIVPDMDQLDVFIALIVFRLLYLIIPLFISLFIVAAFEMQQHLKRKKNHIPPPPQDKALT